MEHEQTNLSDLFSMSAQELEKPKAKKETKNYSNTSTKSAKDYNSAKKIELKLPCRAFYGTEVFEIDYNFFENKEEGSVVDTYDVLDRIKELRGYIHLTKKSVKFEYNEEEAYLGIQYFAGTKGGLNESTEVAKTRAYTIFNSKDCGYDIELTMPKIPCSVIKPFLDFAINTAKEQRECFATMYYDFHNDKFILNIPKQDASRSLVRYELDQEYSNPLCYMQVMDLHSHHVLNTSFSATDDKEDNSPMFHFLVYGIDFEKRTYRTDLRVGLGNDDKFIYLSDDELFSDCGVFS